MTDRKEILITDIPSRLIAGEVGEKGKPGRWRRHPYECGEYSGVMVSCGMRTGPEPLTIRLDAQGPYRIRLGLFKMFEGYQTIARVRLSGDTCCKALPVPVMEQGSDVYIYEILWREADLTGQDLILEGHFRETGSLASIRLEPIDGLTEPCKSDIAFPMAITEDGHGAFTRRPHRRPEDLLENLARIPDDSCMKILLWCISGADLCNYPTEVGTYDYGRSRDNLTDGYWIRDENMRLWRKEGWDSMEVMRDYARSRDWEFHVSMRVQAFAAHYPFDEEFHSEFFHAHPEWRCVDDKGQMIGRMSYAHPQVQDHLLKVFEETLAYDPDGLNLILVRGMPLVLYEPIMLEGFKKAHGLNALELDEMDGRWVAYKSGIITEYMRRVKSLLKGGQRLSAIVPPDKHWCDWGGLDVATWVRDRIVDDLYPVGYRYDERDVHRDDAHRLDIRHYLTLPGRENVRIIPILSENGLPKWREVVRGHLEKGADGYGVWDGSHGPLHVFDDVGYRQMPAYVEPAAEFRQIPVLRMGEFRIDRYHPWECF